MMIVKLRFAGVLYPSVTEISMRYCEVSSRSSVSLVVITPELGSMVIGNTTFTGDRLIIE